MTLPLRKKLPTTVQSTRSQAKALNSKHLRARALLKHGLSVGLLLASCSTSLHAQSAGATPGWQPNRLPQSASMQPLSGGGPQPVSSTSGISENAGNQQPGNSGVVLRWRTSARVGSQPNATSAPNAAAVGAPSTHASLAAQAYEANVARQPATRNGLPAPSQPVNSQVVTASAASHSPSGNPLRSSVAANNARQVNAPAPTFVPRGTSSGQRGAVQPANFQAPVGGAPQAPAGGGLLDGTVAPPNFPVRTMRLRFNRPTFKRHRRLAHQGPSRRLCRLKMRSMFQKMPQHRPLDRRLPTTSSG